MQLFLVRHAHAVTDEEDSARPLSERGQQQLKELAEFFRPNRAFRPAQLWHSPLVRARQTAEGLLRETAPDAALVETTGLLPEDNPEEIASRLGNVASIDSLAVVGHEPHLSALATLLVRGKTNPVAFEMKKGAVLALRRTEGLHKRSGEPRWQICWFVTPGLVGRSPSLKSGEES